MCVLRDCPSPTNWAYLGVHDPAWWWVKASNLGGLGGPVVRFNFMHGFHLFKLLRGVTRLVMTTGVRTCVCGFVRLFKSNELGISWCA